MRKKPQTGYSPKGKKKKKIKEKRKSYVATLFIYSNKRNLKMSLGERIVKLLIYLALRLVIRPKKWRHPEKNYEIIDRTYKRIMSSDFIYIPSSIAFYIIMAFLPVISLILFLSNIDFLENIIDTESIKEVLGQFIPGIRSFVDQIQALELKTAAGIASIVITIISLLISAWIASGGMAKLIFTQSYIYEHKFVGGYWMNRIKGVFMVFAITVGLLVALLTNIQIAKWIDSWNMVHILNYIVKFLFLSLALFGLIFLSFVALFKFSPRYKIKFKNIIPGAMVAAFPTTLFLTFFGLITAVWSYGNYGLLGAMMYVGMTSLLISIFLFMGLIANAAYYKTFIGLTLQRKKTISKK